MRKVQWFEVWADPLNLPHILLLLWDGEAFQVYDPIEKKAEYRSANYDDARFWLAEDEYQLVDGRIDCE